MAFNKNQLKIKRRTLLSGVGAAMGGSALMTQLGSAHPTRLTEFVGKSYDPLSDQEQADASAELLFTPFGAIGELSVAGFTIPIGKEKPPHSDRFQGRHRHLCVREGRGRIHRS